MIAEPIPNFAVFSDHSSCDSPIEGLFYREIQKWLPYGANITRQVECQTPFVTFYLDFLVEFKGRRVGFECDGKEFHEELRDSVRDRAIIAAGHADRIYRIRGRDIVFHLHDALDLIRIREATLFSERGHKNIETLATRERLRTDTFRKRLDGFPFEARRDYGRQREEWECDDTQSDADEIQQTEGPQMPTIIYWTGR